MAVDVRKFTPPADKPYRVIDYVNDKFMALWDLSGDTPHVMTGFEYWDATSQSDASANLERIAGLLNSENELTPKQRVDKCRLLLKPLQLPGLMQSGSLDLIERELKRLSDSLVSVGDLDFA